MCDVAVCFSMCFSFWLVKRLPNGLICVVGGLVVIWVCMCIGCGEVCFRRNGLVVIQVFPIGLMRSVKF
ncbi:hypothetical protein CIPAW_12G031900 [Carya illinoinensis]|uniref:Transmembrane protein n=1 Tax=Carya illinoinensis TaxID=32201 RepID=A0A8T1NNM2_CARIL|nr:hypothetical protein CIPAW_12G031900 [Carya illinoinensis]